MGLGKALSPQCSARATLVANSTINLLRKLYWQTSLFTRVTSTFFTIWMFFLTFLQNQAGFGIFFFGMYKSVMVPSWTSAANAMVSDSVG